MIYLDHNATTPLDPRVLEAMLPYLRDKWGNASSRDHAYGWDASDAVEEARSHVAALINAGPHEILFTSGATESISIALCGLFPAVPAEGGSGNRNPAPVGNLIVTEAEHEAVFGICNGLEARGVETVRIGVDDLGNPDIAQLKGILESHRTKVVCAMAANNETGVIFPLRAIAALARAQGALLFTDAAQALGKIPLDCAADGFDLAAFSAHKLHGPKGIGALYIRGGPQAIPLAPSLHGGGQEQGLRPGTLNVPAIVGFGEACRLAGLEMDAETSRLRGLRDALEAELMDACPEIRVNGDRENRLAHTSNLVFPGVDARALIRDMHEVAASTRSACSSGSSEPSHALKAMGLADADAFASVRFSLGRFTVPGDTGRAAERAIASYRKLRGMGEGSAVP